LGVVLFILVFAQPPFLSTNRSDGCPFWRVISSRKWEVFWKAVENNKKFKVSKEFKNLIEGMLEPDSSLRLSL